MATREENIYIVELEVENARLKASIGEAMYALEKARIWGGMEWRWTHPNAGRAWRILNTVMEEE